MPPESPSLRFDALGHRYWTGTRELLSVIVPLRDGVAVCRKR